MKNLLYTLLLIGSSFSLVLTFVKILPEELLTEFSLHLLHNSYINFSISIITMIALIITIIKCIKEITEQFGDGAMQLFCRLNNNNMFTLKLIGVLLATSIIYLMLRKRINRQRERSLFNVDPNDASLRTCKRCGSSQRKILPEDIPYYDYYVWMPTEQFKTYFKNGKVTACKCVRYLGRPDKVLQNVQ